MSKDDEAERKTFGGIIPARPKGAPGPTPPPLDDLLKRRQTMQGPAKLDFLGTYEERTEHMAPEVPDTASVEFEAFMEILRLLRGFPKKVRKQLIETIADLLD